MAFITCNVLLQAYTRFMDSIINETQYILLEVKSWKVGAVTVISKQLDTVNVLTTMNWVIWSRILIFPRSLLNFWPPDWRKRMYFSVDRILHFIEEEKTTCCHSLQKKKNNLVSTMPAFKPSEENYPFRI